jgi:LSD1 subclass zinc finger protein
MVRLAWRSAVSGSVMFILVCAGCEHPLKLPDDAAGKVIRCLKCKSIIMVSPRQRESSEQATAIPETLFDRRNGKPAEFQS